MKMILMLKGGREAMLKAMGNEVRTGKYYDKAGKVALNIHGKSNYHFDYSKGGKKGHAEHSKYGKMTSGLKHQSEFQKQASKSKGKVVKIKAGTHSEKRRDKKGKIVTRHVSNKPKVKGTKKAAGSVVNKPKPEPTSTGAQEPVAKTDLHGQYHYKRRGGMEAFTVFPEHEGKHRVFAHGTGRENEERFLSGDKVAELIKQHGDKIERSDESNLIKKYQTQSLFEDWKKNKSSSIDSAISGAQTIINKPGIKIKGMKRNLTKDYAEKPKRHHSNEAINSAINDSLLAMKKKKSKK